MREEGFYWVEEDGEWIVGQFKNESWYFCDPMLDRPGGWLDEDLDEIDENRIIRTAK
jgi:hypothetical protein